MEYDFDQRVSFEKGQMGDMGVQARRRATVRVGISEGAKNAVHRKRSHGNLFDRIKRRMLEVIEMTLTPEQVDAVAPLVRSHVTNGRNSLFISTFIPDLNVWRWQIISVSRSVGQRLLKILKEESQESKSP
jgi:hypothetical protein